MAEFPPYFDNLKRLAAGLRDILFPYLDGLFTGTYRDPSKLYKPIINALDRAITKYTEI